MNGVFKTPKRLSFNKTMVLETTKFIVSKHPTIFENQSILKNLSISPILWKYFVSKHGLHANYGVIVDYLS